MSISSPEPVMPRPDYQGGGLVNLMSSIAQAVAAPSGYRTLEALPPDELRGTRNVVLMVLDGLGYEYFMRNAADGPLREHLRARLTSVFPTTTASAITTFLTATAPQQHAITGWFVNLREVGAVTAVLPFRTRGGGRALGDDGIDVGAILDHPVVFDSVTVPAYIVTDEKIVDSEFSVATSGAAHRVAYRGLEGYFERIARTVRADEQRKYVYAYWPGFDGISHDYGIESAEAAKHLADIEAGFERLLEALAGTDTTLVVTADHGLVDTGGDRVIHMHDHPELERCLTMPLCGEPRLVYCYVHPDRAGLFERYVTEHLSRCCTLHRGEDLIAEGYYGLGQPHPRLRERVGDYVLVMKDDYILKDRVLGEPAFDQIGVHGGLSEGELYVPLVVAKM